MYIKICGLTTLVNINEIAKLHIDMMGFIFYKKSPRFVGDNFDKTILTAIPSAIHKVGVFVDEKAEIVLQKQLEYQLDFIQLHGNETVNYCQKLKNNGLKLIKAFNINEDFNFDNLKPYQKVCDYFLFDTKGKEKGGNGISFNWDVLQKYHFDTPFLLSGGIGLHNIDDALTIKHPKLLGMDINSKIEIKPGIKSIESASSLTSKIIHHASQKTR